MSRIPLIHMKGKAAGSWMGMPKAAEAPTGLRMKLMPIAMIATGTTSVHQNSSEFFLNVELSRPVFMCVVRAALPARRHACERSPSLGYDHKLSLWRSRPLEFGD